MLSNEQIAQLNAAGFAHCTQMSTADARRTLAQASEKLARAFAQSGRDDHADFYARKAKRLRQS